MRLFSILIILAITACTPTSAEEAAVTRADEGVIVPKALTPEEAEEAMSDVGKGWLYGDGLGTAMLNIGTTVIFPPYGIFLLGNLALSASGTEPVGVGMFLEGEDEDQWDQMFSTAVSGPGRVAAAISGEEYVSPETSREKLLQYTELQVDGVMGEY